MSTPLTKEFEKKISANSSSNKKPTKIYLPFQIPIRINTIPSYLIPMEIINEKDNENLSNERINSYISNAPKNRWLPSSSNQNNLNLQDMDSYYSINFNIAKKIHPIQPFINEINKIENDQLKNISNDGIIESELESESLKEIDPYISYGTSNLNKYQSFNINHKNNKKNKKKLKLNNIRYNKNKNNLNDHNKINCNKYKNSSNEKTNYTQNSKKGRKILTHFNTNILEWRNEFTVNYKSDKKLIREELTENIIPKKSFNYSVDLSKMRYLESSKKRNIEKQKLLKIKKMKNIRDFYKKIINESRLYNSGVNFSNRHILNRGPKNSNKITKNKNQEKKETSRQKNKKNSYRNLSVLKKNFIKLKTFDYKFINYIENNQKTNNKKDSIPKSYQKKNLEISYNDNISLVKNNINQYLSKRSAIQKIRKRAPGSFNKKEKPKGNQTNPFIYDNFNSSFIRDGNNSSVLSRVMLIIDKKFGYMSKTNRLYNVKLRNQSSNKKNN